jgi:hypothetical protein
MGDISTLLFQTYILCVFIALTTRVKRDDNPDSVAKPDKIPDFDWVTKIAVLVGLLTVGFIVMLIISYKMTENHSGYHMSITFFFVFIIACFINLFQSVIVGMKIEFADDFKRKLFV